MHKHTCDHKASSETAVVLRSQDMAPHEGEEQAEVAGQDIGLAPEEVASGKAKMGSNRRNHDQIAYNVQYNFRPIFIEILGTWYLSALG